MHPTLRAALVDASMAELRPRHALAKSLTAERHQAAAGHRLDSTRATRRSDSRPRRRPEGVLPAAWRWTR